MRVIPLCLTLSMLSVSPTIAADDDAFNGYHRPGWHDPGHDWHDPRSPVPEIEVIVDGLYLGDQERPEETPSQEATVRPPCHQAGGTTWSTRAQPCNDPTPPERSRVWSTSP